MLVLAALAVFAESLCIDSKTYAECDCGADGAADASAVVLFVTTKRCCRRDRSELDSEYSVIAASMLGRGCYKLECEGCEIVAGDAEKCDFVAPSGRVVVHGTGTIRMRYAHDLPWMYPVYAVASLLGICIIVVLIIATVKRARNTHDEQNGEPQCETQQCAQCACDAYGEISTGECT